MTNRILFSHPLLCIICGIFAPIRALKRKDEGVKLCPKESLWSDVEEIINSYDCQRHHLIAIMQDIQAEYKYLSPQVLERIAQMLDIGVAKVYSVATFYENFSLEAKGKYIIKVCDGTACHVRKSQPIYNAIREYLELEGKQKTSADGLFTLETVACLGACGLAPVVTVNDQVHSKMTRNWPLNCWISCERRTPPMTMTNLTREQLQVRQMKARRLWRPSAARCSSAPVPAASPAAP